MQVYGCGISSAGDALHSSFLANSAFARVSSSLCHHNWLVTKNVTLGARHSFVVTEFAYRRIDPS